MSEEQKPYTRDDLVRAIQQVAREAAPRSKQSPQFVSLIRQHFGRDPPELQSLQQEFPVWEHPTVHMALQECLEQAEGEVRVHGRAPEYSNESMSFADLLKTRSPPEPAPVEHMNITLRRPCGATVRTLEHVK